MTPQRRCPVCGKPAVAEKKPFCSRRCAEIDLGRWLTESYALPAGRDEDEAPENDGETDR